LIMGALGLPGRRRAWLPYHVHYGINIITMTLVSMDCTKEWTARGCAAKTASRFADR
jgi:hypothetical protein